MAVRESETAAESLGVNVTKYKIMAFIISSALAGLGGSMFAPLSRYVSPDGFTLVPSIVILSMLVIGGLGSHLGAVLGGALMVLLPEFIGFVGGYRVFVYSVCLLLVIVFMPEGLAGMVKHFTAFARMRFVASGLQSQLDSDVLARDAAGQPMESSLERPIKEEVK